MRPSTSILVIAPMDVMRSLIAGLFGLLLACSVQAADNPAPGGPKIDKARLEGYIRYAEGFTDSVKITVDDPTPSPFPGLQRLRIHLSAGAQRLDRLYYIDSNGQQVISGNVWNLNSSPFLDTLEHLPMNGPAFGPADAKITVVVFSDFQCPYCRQFAQTIRDNAPKKYPNDVRVVFADFPLDAIHPWARAASEAAHCVGDDQPDKFWTYHDWVFQNQGDFHVGNIREKTVQFAKDKGWDSAKIDSCIANKATAAEVDRNLQAGLGLQVQQTPTVFLNGRMLGGAVSWATLDTLIKMELNRPKEIPVFVTKAAASGSSGAVAAH